jgi:hypothetical protein
MVQEKFLCVAIHDVAPATWPLCRRLLDAVNAVGDLPLTWLVVPHYHAPCDGVPARCDGRNPDQHWEHSMQQRLARGDELALHGLCHVDHGPRPQTPLQYLLRRCYTTGEGEFAALGQADAHRRMQRGLDWFALRGWPVTGFVAPAWLMSAGSWQAVRALPFRYTTTLSHFYRLPHGNGEFAPSLVYSARNASGPWLSTRLNTFLHERMAQVSLLRLGLHPADARHPELLRYLQALLEDSLRDRRPLTKAQYAACPALALVRRLI